MNVSMRKSLAALIVASSLFALFQNCAPAKVTSSESESALSSNADQGSSAPPSSPPSSTPAPTPTPVLGASISVSTTSVNFGTVPAGASSSPKLLTVTNNGSAVLRITAKSFNVSLFREDTFSSTCQSSLGPGASCTIGLVFDALILQNTTAIFRIDSNAVNSPTLIQLQGTAGF